MALLRKNRLTVGIAALLLLLWALTGFSVSRNGRVAVLVLAEDMKTLLWFMPEA